MHHARNITCALLLIASNATTSLLHADVTLPSIFSEHMVLQRSAQTPVWGRADAGEKITLTLAPITRDVTTGGDGRWRIDLDLSDTTRFPSGPHQLVIKGKNQIVLADILIGEVWLASGQSNMSRNMDISATKDEIAQSANDQIRFFTVRHKASPTPVADVSGNWIKASPKTTPRLSAVACYFARHLQAGLGIPIGMIHSSWGGTPVEAWTSLEALQNNPLLAAQALGQIEYFANFPATKSAWLATLKPWLAANQREDRPTPGDELAACTTHPAVTGTNGWSTVRLPGKLPGERILWIRRPVDVPQAAHGKPLTIDVDEIVGVDTVYFSGKKVGGRTLDTYDGDGRARLNARRLYEVPASDVTVGTHTLAIRIYAPLGEAAINASPYFTAGAQSLFGDWLLKTEYAFPPLPPAARATKPAPLKAPLRPWNVPASLYNGMIHPLIPYALRGCIWYQGEYDAGQPRRYRTSFPALINDWRARWSGSGPATQDSPLSFYWCQLPSFQEKTTDPSAFAGWTGIRESQTLTLKLPRTGQAVLIDAGEAGDSHPQSKREAGARLAALALANDYGKNITFTGPVYDRMTVEGSAIRIHFKDTNSPLIARSIPREYLYKSLPRRITRPLQRNSPGSQLEGFVIRGAASGKWHWASAKIDPSNNTIVVFSPDVSQPQAVRYAWSSNPTCNLYNAAGFPACPFRTDTD